MINLFHRHNQTKWKIEQELKQLHKEKQKIKERQRKLIEKLKEFE